MNSHLQITECSCARAGGAEMGRAVTMSSGACSVCTALELRGEGGAETVSGKMIPAAHLEEVPRKPSK